MQLMLASRSSPQAEFGVGATIPALGIDHNDGDPDLSDDGTTLWFASDRPGGIGGYDLWFATRACE